MGRSCQNSASPHFWWLFSILGVIIILLVSYILTCSVSSAYKIMEYISYASVILSVTLSIFAILYTYTSNVQIQQQFEKINSAANNITLTSNNLNVTNTQLNDNLKQILDRLDSISNKQHELSGEINNVNTAINSSSILNMQSQITKKNTESEK